MQTANDLPMDEFHVGTAAANLGWALNGATHIRGTVHYGVAATGVPNAWDFYHVADDATEKDQDIFASGSIDTQTTASFHQSATYGLTRKREQYTLWNPRANCMRRITMAIGDNPTSACFSPSPAPTATARQARRCSTTPALTRSEDQLVSNRDQLVYRGDITITPHLYGLIGFQYEDERGAEPGSSLYPPVERSNYDYQAAVHGDFKQRFFYSLGGSLEHYSLFGVQTPPRAGVSYYLKRPHSGAFSGTRILFNYGESDREPTLPEQDESLYAFLKLYNPAEIRQLHIDQIDAPQDRTYEGGVEQTFFNSHILFRASYFHNEFGTAD